MNDSEMRAQFGKALRYHRSERRIAQGALAEAVGVTQASYSQWEAGNTEPDRTALLAVEVALGLTPGELSRYLGWIPVNPEDAPQVPEPTTRRIVMSSDTGQELMTLSLEIKNNREFSEMARRFITDTQGRIQTNPSFIAAMKSMSKVADATSAPTAAVVEAVKDQQLQLIELAEQARLESERLQCLINTARGIEPVATLKPKNKVD